MHVLQTDTRRLCVSVSSAASLAASNASKGLGLRLRERLDAAGLQSFDAAEEDAHQGREVGQRGCDGGVGPLPAEDRQASE